MSIKMGGASTMGATGGVKIQQQAWDISVTSMDVCPLSATMRHQSCSQCCQNGRHKAFYVVNNKSANQSDIRCQREFDINCKEGLCNIC